MRATELAKRTAPTHKHITLKTRLTLAKFRKKGKFSITFLANPVSMRVPV